MAVVTADAQSYHIVVTNGVNGVLCEARNAASLQATNEQMLAMTDKHRCYAGSSSRQQVEAEFDKQPLNKAAPNMVEEVLLRGKT